MSYRIESRKKAAERPKGGARSTFLQMLVVNERTGGREEGARKREQIRVFRSSVETGNDAICALKEERKHRSRHCGGEVSEAGDRDRIVVAVDGRRGSPNYLKDRANVWGS